MKIPRTDWLLRPRLAIVPAPAAGLRDCASAASRGSVGQPRQGHRGRVGKFRALTGLGIDLLKFERVERRARTSATARGPVVSRTRAGRNGCSGAGRTRPWSPASARRRRWPRCWGSGLELRNVEMITTRAALVRLEGSATRRVNQLGAEARISASPPRGRPRAGCSRRPRLTGDRREGSLSCTDTQIWPWPRRGLIPRRHGMDLRHRRGGEAFG